MTARIFQDLSTLLSKVCGRIALYIQVINSVLKGTVFDVTAKAEVYGAGKSYNVFAGKDGSRGLGMSSLKADDAVADYSDLDEKDMKVLNDWYSFFE